MKHTVQSFVIAFLLYSSLLSVLFFGWQQITQVPAESANQPLPITLNMFAQSQPANQPSSEPNTTPPQVATVQPETPQPAAAESKAEPLKQPKPQADHEPEHKPNEQALKKPISKPVAEKPPIKPLEHTPVLQEPAPQPIAPPVDNNKQEKQPPTITEQKFQPDDEPLTAIKTTKIDTTPVKQESSNRVEQAEQRYLLELRQQIVRFAEDTYPRMARRRHWQGQVMLEIVIQANGDISNIEIINGSKHNILDQAALEIFTLRMQNRFKAFPEEIQRQNWTIRVPVNYRLY